MFGKIFESTFTGSMVGIGPVTFAVWSYVIANTKPPGHVELNASILSVIIGCTTEEILEAIEKLCAIDANSRSKERDGRRLIREGPFLFFVPTWEHYRSARNDDERRQYNRDAQRRSRASRLDEAVKRDVSIGQHDVKNVSSGQQSCTAVCRRVPRSAQAEAEAEAEAELLACLPGISGSGDSEARDHVPARDPPTPTTTPVVDVGAVVARVAKAKRVKR